MKKRQALRAGNKSAWDGDLILIPHEKLDSSLKKNTLFIKKCRSFTKDSETLIREVEALSIQKYLSEVIPSLVEGFTNCKTSSDYFAGVEVASALHQRFGSVFTAPFLALFFAGIAYPTKDDLKTMSDIDITNFLEEANQRHRMILRAVTEFWLSGLCTSAQQLLEAGENLPAYVLTQFQKTIPIPPFAILTNILEHNDPETWSSVDILLVYIKLYGDTFLGLGGETHDEMVTPEIVEMFQKQIDRFWSKLSKYLKQLKRSVLYAISKNEKMFLSYGTVPSSGSDDLDTLRKKLDFLVPKYRAVCAALKIEPSNFDIEPVQDMNIAISIANFEQDSIWEEVEERKFYENLPDLTYLRAKNEESSEGTPEMPDNVDKEAPSAGSGDEALIMELQSIISQPEIQPGTKETAETVNSESQSIETNDDYEVDEENRQRDSAKMNSNLASLLNYFLAKPSRETVDEAAQSYVQYDNRSTRKSIIVKFTRDVTFHNTFQVPFIARFLAILNNMAPEIVEQVVEYYSNFFSYLVAKRHVKALESRRDFVTTMLCELTKFGLTSKMEIGKAFILAIRSLDDLSALIISQLLEGCGRYVVRKPKTRELMSKILFTLRNQMKVKYLDVASKLLLENALAYLEPIKPTKKKVKIRSPTELFVRQLLLQDLPVYGEESVFLHIKNLNWADYETIEILERIFIKIHKVSHSDVWRFTLLLKRIGDVYPCFQAIIVDGLLEHIRRELENSSFKSNQKRVMQLQYLANMTGCNIVGCDTLLKTLYLLVGFGYKDGRPQSDSKNPLDVPGDFIRIRLVCSALSARNGFQSRSNSADLRELDKFVNYFLYYIFTKPKLPADVEHAVRETLGHIYPQVQLPKYLFESRDELAAFLSSRSLPTEDSKQRSEKIVKKKLDALDFRRGAYGLRKAIVEEGPEVRDLEEEEREALIQERKASKLREREEKAAEDEFDEEFKKLMLDRVETRDGNNLNKKAPLFSAPLPKSFGSEPVTSVPAQQSKVKFQILTKRTDSGLKTVAVPSELKFVSSTIAEKNRLQKEQNHIAKFILNYVRNDGQGEGRGEELLERPSNPQLKSVRYRKEKEFSTESPIGEPTVQ